MKAWKREDGWQRADTGNLILDARYLILVISPPEADELGNNKKW